MNNHDTLTILYKDAYVCEVQVSEEKAACLLRLPRVANGMIGECLSFATNQPPMVHERLNQGGAGQPLLPCIKARRMCNHGHLLAYRQAVSAAPAVATCRKRPQTHR
jgi:hypothetical protein